jgi:hypothetical protein
MDPSHGGVAPESVRKWTSYLDRGGIRNGKQLSVHRLLHKQPFMCARIQYNMSFLDSKQTLLFLHKFGIKNDLFPLASGQSRSRIDVQYTIHISTLVKGEMIKGYDYRTLDAKNKMGQKRDCSKLYQYCLYVLWWFLNFWYPYCKENQVPI